MPYSTLLPQVLSTPRCVAVPRISTEGGSSSYFLLAASFSRGDFIPKTNQQTTLEAFSPLPFHYYLSIRSTVY